jgi:hypothetical protein
LLSHRIHPVANGLRTDHPIPELPFVDDTHIPVDDPIALEAIGRKHGTDTWGREDRCREGGWVAFTTDPTRHDLAWLVRWHPDHGRSVVLYRDADASSAHMAYWGPALLFRAGGYWWDGTTWYRPAQVFDLASEGYLRREVPAAMVVTAADLLRSGGDHRRAKILGVEQVDLDAPLRDHWLNDLALWAERRIDDLPLAACVTKLTAPELTGDQLVGVVEMAEIAGVAPSTLRAYISRGEAEVPLPQATVGGRAVWARPVAEEWAEQRRRSPEGITAVVSTGRVGSAQTASGVADVSNWFARLFFSRLWESPGYRKRWTLRWRTESAVREIAQDLSWDVAANLTRIVPTSDLAAAIHHAVLDELTTGKHLERDVDDPVFYGISRPVTKMLDWLIRHNPDAAGYTIGEIIGEAERNRGISRKISEESLRTALGLDGSLDRDTRDEFLDRVLTPDADK